MRIPEIFKTQVPQSDIITNMIAQINGKVIQKNRTNISQFKQMVSDIFIRHQPIFWQKLIWEKKYLYGHLIVQRTCLDLWFRNNRRKSLFLKC